MKQHEIETFLAIIEYGSISAAADKLYIGQPTLSSRIQALEAELNTTLFLRGRGHKNIKLTAEGKRFEPYARKWMKLWSETLAAIQNENGRILNISSSHTFNTYIMPEIYLRLQDQLRSVSLHLGNNHYKEIYQQVESGESEFGFTSRTQFSKDLMAYPLYNDDFVLVAAAAHPYPPQVRPERLDIHKAMHIDWSDTFREWHTYWFSSQGPVAAETTDASFLEHFISIEGNWAIVPRTMANSLYKRSMASISELTDSPPIITTYLITPLETDPLLPSILSVMADVVAQLGGHWIYRCT